MRERRVRQPLAYRAAVSAVVVTVTDFVTVAVLPTQSVAVTRTVAVPLAGMAALTRSGVLDPAPTTRPFTAVVTAQIPASASTAGAVMVTGVPAAAAPGRKVMVGGDRTGPLLST